MRKKLLPMTLAPLLLAAACGSSDSSTGSTSTAQQEATPSPAAAEPDEADEIALTQGPPSCPSEGEEFETAKLYIEHNATDADTGVHGLFGGEAWTELCISAPDGRQILLVDPIEQLDELAIADFFFESREPPNDEVAIAEIEAAFPEGEYTVAGTDYEGVARLGTATFTHDIPVEPTIVTPPLADDAETAGEAVASRKDLVVTWEPVTETIHDDPVTVVAYEVIVTKEDHDDPNGLSRPVYDVHVGPETTSLGVPEEFLEPNVVYELEVLVLEESGNQTIGLGFFTSGS